MKVEFSVPKTAPATLLCDVSITFEHEPELVGFLLTGFSIRHDRGRIFVLVPALRFGVGNERAYYHLLRPVGGGNDRGASDAALNELRDRILDAWTEAGRPGWRPELQDMPKFKDGPKAAQR